MPSSWVAGIVGLAAARELLLRRPGSSVVVLEREDRIAAHQSSHNSGVIQAGVYYEPGSLKARLCVEGARELYAFCAEQGVATRRCGKLIGARRSSTRSRGSTSWSAAPRRTVSRRGASPRRRSRDAEPACRGIAALHVADSRRLVDSRGRPPHWRATSRLAAAP